MPVYTEMLPARKSSKRSVIEWVPTSDDFGPSAGVLTIRTDRASCAYLVEEFPADFAGRSFMLFKIEGEHGTDKTAERYAVFCGEFGHEMCDCKGFTRFGHCKHTDACTAIIGNKWV